MGTADLLTFPQFDQHAQHRCLSDVVRLRLVRFSATTLTRSWNQTHTPKPYWRVYVNLDRGATIACGGRRTALEPGQVVLVPPWRELTSMTADGVRHIYAHVELLGVSRATAMAQAHHAVRIGGAPGAALASDWQAQATTLYRRDPDLDLVARVTALAWRTILCALPDLETIMRGALSHESTHRRAGKVLTWVDAHLTEPLSLGAIAAHLGLSPATTTRLFTAAFAMPPARFLGERRIARAADLLTTTRDSIEAIADACGFPNRSYFSRVFSRRMGIGPAGYRRIR